MERVSRDVRGAVRQIAHQPGFALAVIATLGLAIGANTAIYSVVHAVLLRPLPFAEPDRLVMIRANVEGLADVGVLSAPELLDVRERVSTLGAVGAIWGSSGAITGEAPEQIRLAWVTANLFPLLGVSPVAGRGFLEAEDQSGTDPVVLISEELWRRRFAADPALVGRTIDVDDTTYTVVGVMPAGLAVPRGAFQIGLHAYDVWMPQRFWTTRGQRWLSLIGRLAPGATLTEARADLAALAGSLAGEHAEYAGQDFHLSAVPVHGQLVDRVRPALVALAFAVGFVLLIACTNVAALLLVRARGRAREIAVRRALGASRGQLASQLLAESLILSLLGGAAGLAVAYWGLGLVDLLSPANLPRLNDVALNSTILTGTLAVSVLTGIACSLVPMLQASATDPRGALADDTRTTAGPGHHAGRHTLVAAQLALSVVLLVGAGLMIRTMVAERGQDPGFSAGGVISFRAPIAFQGHETGELRWRFYQDYTDRLRALPGVEAAGGVSILPLDSGLFTAPYAWDVASESGWGQHAADYRTVIPGYFDTIRARVIAGRDFDEADAGQHARVVLVDESLARNAWPGERAVGRRLKVLMNETGNQQFEEWVEVIGVVAHVRMDDLRQDGAPQVYRPFWLDHPTRMTITARLSSDPTAILPAARELAQELGAGRPIHAERLLSGFVDDAAAETRFVSFLLSGFAGIALLMTAVGLYGLIAHMVSLRTREIGVRLALGATPAGVRRLVLASGLRLAAAGLLCGLVLSPVATRGMSTLLFGVGTLDALTYGLAVFGFVAVASIACLLPARRASRVDPIVTLRSS